MARAAAELIGRDKELAAIAGFLEPGAHARAVAIDGEPGIGKTTLWEAAATVASGRGFFPLRAGPGESEAKLAYSGLADLLSEALPEVAEELPPPQRQALEVALLLEDGGAARPDRRAVAAGVVGSLRALAAKGPLLIAIDDVQWLDRSSAAALEFAARRLRDEPVAFLLARRLGAEEGESGIEHSLPSERVLRTAIGPLEFIPLNALLHERLGSALPRPVLRRIHELSGGNPFFALELARMPERLVTGELPATLDALVSGRLSALPVTAQHALLTAAAASQPTADLVERVVGEPESLAPAEAAHLVLLERGRVRFVHPLLASGAYAAAEPAERRDVHRRLAELVREPEERARHLAAAATGPDEKVAAALERAAGRARSRGAPAAAAELSEEAAGLTPPERGIDRRRRLADAGYYHFESADGRRATELLDGLVAELSPGPERADALIRLARVRSYSDDLQAATELFLRAAEEAGDDRALEARALEGAAAQLFRQRRRLDEAVEHARKAAAFARELGDDELLALALASQLLAEATLGRSEATKTLEQALALQQAAEAQRLLGQPKWAAAVAHMWWEQPAAVRETYEELIERGRETGDESSLAYVYVMLAQADCLLGDFERSGRDVEAAREIAEQAGQETLVAYALAVRAYLDAHRGRAADARHAAAKAVELGRDLQFTPVSQFGGAALGLLELSLGRADRAAEHLGPLAEFARVERIDEPGLTRFVPDQIEALIELGRLEEAETLLDWYEGNATRLGRRGASAASLRCRALLAAARGRLDESLGIFERALAEHDGCPFPFDRARTLLAFGAALRRAKRKADSRRTLEEARSAFEALGAAAFADRTTAELERIGGRRASAGLTATQRQIAELVAEGRSNKEVAAALFVTVKTVEANLSRIYAKLGLRSRAELAGHLAAREPASKL